MKKIITKVKNLIPLDLTVISNEEKFEKTIKEMETNKFLRFKPTVVIKESTIQVLNPLIKKLKRYHKGFSKEEDIKMLKERINNNSYYICDGHNRSYLLELFNKDIVSNELEKEEDIKQLRIENFPMILNQTTFDKLRQNIIDLIIDRLMMPGCGLSQLELFGEIQGAKILPRVTMLEYILADKMFYENTLCTNNLSEKLKIYK